MSKALSGLLRRYLSYLKPVSIGCVIMGSFFAPSYQHAELVSFFISKLGLVSRSYNEKKITASLESISFSKSFLEEITRIHYKDIGF